MHLKSLWLNRKFKFKTTRPFLIKVLIDEYDIQVIPSSAEGIREADVTYLVGAAVCKEHLLSMVEKLDVKVRENLIIVFNGADRSGVQRMEDTSERSIKAAIWINAIANNWIGVHESSLFYTNHYELKIQKRENSDLKEKIKKEKRENLDLKEELSREREKIKKTEQELKKLRQEIEELKRN